MVQMLTAGTTGKLTGLISDKDSGEALIGCNVIVADTDLGTASNESGEYYILNIKCKLFIYTIFTMHILSIYACINFEIFIKLIKFEIF